MMIYFVKRQGVAAFVGSGGDVLPLGASRALAP